MKRKPAPRRKAPVASPARRRVQSKSLTPAQIKLLRRDFAIVELQADIAALAFYQHLFTLDPSLRSLFHTSIELQGRKLMEALQYTLAALEKPAELVPVLMAMGRRHVAYGVQNQHYRTVAQAMLMTLRDALRNNYTAAAARAWRLALEFVCEAMQRGADTVEELLRNTPTPALRAANVRSY